MKRFTIGIGLVFAISVLAFGTVRMRSGETEESAVARVIVLVDSSTSGDRLPFTPGEHSNLIVVTSMEAAKAEDARESVAGILIESQAAGAADWAWIQSKFVAGSVVGGININISPLLELLRPASGDLFGEDGLGYSSEDPGWPADRRFYSLLVGGPGCAQGQTEYFDMNLAEGVFIGRLNSALGCAADQVGLPSQTSEEGASN